MADYVTDNRIKWIKSDGTVLNHGAAAANSATYYAELPRMTRRAARGFWLGLVWDATDVSSYTLESCGTPSADLAGHAAAGSGWKSKSVEFGTIASAASASCGEWQLADVQAPRWRVKRSVTTGGVATVRAYLGDL